MISARSWLLVALAAVLQVLPFPIAGPVPFWRRVFCWFCITPLLLAFFCNDTEDKPLSPKQTAVLGYACGFLWYLGNCYWIFQTMHIYGGIPEAGALGILVLFALYLGLYLGLFGWIVGALKQHFSRQVVLCVTPFAWVAVELCRARITGFPWDLLGYTQVDNHLLTRVAPLAGVFSLSLLVAIINVLWLQRIKTSTKWTYICPFGAILFVLGASLAGSMYKGAAAVTENKAVLLQDNLSVGEERVANTEPRNQMVASFISLSLHAQSVPPSIVIWPEAPADFSDADPEFRDALAYVALHAKAPAIADSMAVANQLPRQLFNSASFFDANGNHVGRYDKMHLVPFGEYTPYKQLFFFAGHLLDNVGPFIPGTVRQLFVTGGHHYGVFICYESIFGDEVREFAKLGADVLVNISDDGWYGDSSAPWEHLDMARMRAIENDRWVLRATNTGVTGAIDPEGRIVAQMPRHIRGAISVPFSYRTGTTFYTKHGDWIAWICMAISCAALVTGFSRKRAVN